MFKPFRELMVVDFLDIFYRTVVAIIIHNNQITKIHLPNTDQVLCLPNLNFLFSTVHSGAFWQCKTIFSRELHRFSRIEEKIRANSWNSRQTICDVR